MEKGGGDMNKKQKVFILSMILILLVAVAILVTIDAAAVMRTTIINPNVKTEYVKRRG